ncbi:MAG: non-canonical purine NTP pyrophosphatase, RdgB/HAM1 family [Deltaproteobacteria bacterium]|nr:non-canonical purine NTP pyrophosphatase, RdgB/HAM1 family [Deltaproteobacteria bacterium]
MQSAAVTARIVVASQNAGKRREIARILTDVEVLSLADVGPVAFPEEGGDYFENARAKALAAARATGLPCVADDSGLEVEALGGAPGPYSARYGGPGLDDRGRLEALLAALAGVAAPRRARFFCAAACALPDGRCEVAEGICPGEILEVPWGAGGFGYDPIFRPEGFDRAMAELAREEKDALSHRGRAFAVLAPAIADLLGVRAD